MGTVNYGTSDYITLGIILYDEVELLNDPVFMKELREEVEEYGGTVENAFHDYISGCYESDEENAQYILDRFSFWYFHLAIKPGYYEGFSLDIESNFPVAFDNWEERKAAQREITQIKKCLIELAGVGLVACFPGWCTGYLDYKGTLQRINEAIKEMREEVKATPTWRQYEREAV